MERQKLGQALVDTRKLNKENLKYALAMHDKIGGDFAPLLVKLGYISDQDLTSTLAKLEGIPTIDVSSIVLPINLMRTLSRDIIEKYNVLPINKKGGQITLAMSNVNDLEAIEEIQFLSGCRVEPILASRQAIRKAIIQFYEDEELRQQEEIIPDEEVPDIHEILNGTREDFQILQRAAILLLLEKGILSEEKLRQKFEELKSLH